MFRIANFLKFMRFWLFFILLTFLLLAVVGYVIIVPQNSWSVTNACDGIDQRWVSHLTPSVRVLEESNPATDQVGQRTLLAEPVYLEIAPPRPFAQATVMVDVGGLPVGQSFAIGVVNETKLFSPVLAPTGFLPGADNVWVRARARIPLQDIRQTNTGGYKFIFSAPGFTNRAHQLQIKNCTIEFSGRPTWRQLARWYGIRLLNHSK